MGGAVRTLKSGSAGDAGRGGPHIGNFTGPGIRSGTHEMPGTPRFGRFRPGRDLNTGARRGVLGSAARMKDAGEPVREPDRPARLDSRAADGGSGEPAASRTAGEPELVRRVQRGDEAAFGRLVERYLDRAHAVALGILGNPHDAEDAVQDAFIRALERIDQLSPGSPFGPWFYRVLRSTALNFRRHEKLRSHEAIPLGAATSGDPEEETLRKIDREAVLRALEQLPEMQRTAVTLYDLEGYSHQEIADILGIAPGTSRAHVHHGRKALQRLLETEEDEDR